MLQEEGKNSVYLFVFCLNLGEINALLTISCCQMKHFGYVMYGVGNPVACIFFLYSIVQYQIGHTFKLDCCHHLRPSDVSYFTIFLRNPANTYFIVFDLT
jgi:hypothetical protein